MPNSGTAKTESAPKRTSAISVKRMAALLVLLGLLTVAVTAFVLFFPHPGQRPTYKLVVNPRPEPSHGQDRQDGTASTPWVYYLRGAMTSADQQKGLSGTKALGFNQGMIFVYDRTENRCFWMKDMHYDLDIIWADTDRKVTAVEQDISPDTYPQKFCHDGQYIIELNADEAAKAGIVQGQKLNF